MKVHTNISKNPLLESSLLLIHSDRLTYVLKIKLLPRFTASSLSNCIDPYLKILKDFSAFLEFLNLKWQFTFYNSIKCFFSRYWQDTVGSLKIYLAVKFRRILVCNFSISGVPDSLNYRITFEMLDTNLFVLSILSPHKNHIHNIDTYLIVDSLYPLLDTS